MAKMPENKAAWLVGKNKPLEVKEAPSPTPNEHEIVIGVHAVAINPVDRLIAIHGPLFFNWLKFPMILGSDMAGEVVQIGSSVKRFKVGDRVVTMGLGTAKPEQSTGDRESAFQLYSIAREHMTSPIPDSMTYEDGSVFPLATSTAASGLYQKDYLALQHPTVPARKPTGKTVLIWGGSTSVGCSAIQLAVSSGYEVFATCSPRNFDLMKKLGASRAFDYKNHNIIPDIIAAFKGKECAGALSMGAGSVEKCLDILTKIQGSKMLAMASQPGQPQELPTTLLGIIGILLPMMWAGFLAWWKCCTHGLRTNFIFGSDLMANEVGPAIFVDYLPEALKGGQFVASPEAIVVGKGLDKIQEAFNVQKKGVSAKKVVVSI